MNVITEEMRGSNGDLILHKNGITKINGKNLFVSKMLDNEVLIEGEIKSIVLS